MWGRGHPLSLLSGEDMTRNDLIQVIIEMAAPSLTKQVTYKKLIGKNLWMTDTKRSKKLAKKKKK
jgi:hypothetical protein